MNKFRMISFKARLILLLACLVSPTSWAVVILESTYKQYGFKPAETLALEPQFSCLIYLQSDSSSGSGAWIGNYQGHGYVLTAGHMLPPETNADDYSYLTTDGTEYDGDKVYLHPLWNNNSEDRTGYDFAIVRLTEEVTDIGPQPAYVSRTTRIEIH